ncbi:MAG: hypothetical protein IT431_03455 [Phycisphaerales bacterium]|nr:hypothetical protein [Phycisphaerales bacterium]
MISREGLKRASFLHVPEFCEVLASTSEKLIHRADDLRSLAHTDELCAVLNRIEDPKLRVATALLGIVAADINIELGVRRGQVRFLQSTASGLGIDYQIAIGLLRRADALTDALGISREISGYASNCEHHS